MTWQDWVVLAAVVVALGAFWLARRAAGRRRLEQIQAFGLQCEANGYAAARVEFAAQLGASASVSQTVVVGRDGVSAGGDRAVPDGAVRAGDLAHPAAVRMDEGEITHGRLVDDRRLSDGAVHDPALVDGHRVYLAGPRDGAGVPQGATRVNDWRMIAERAGAEVERRHAAHGPADVAE